MRRAEYGLEPLFPGGPGGGAGSHDVTSSPEKIPESRCPGHVIGTLEGEVERIEFLDLRVVHRVESESILERVLEGESDSRDDSLAQREKVTVGIFRRTSRITETIGCRCLRIGNI